MSDHHFETSKSISFTEGVCLLGFDTNGAAPQRIYGLFVEAELYADADRSEGLTESYWLKAYCSPDLDAAPKEGPRPEYVMYGDNLAQIEKVLGAIASASCLPGYDQRLQGKFDGYHNSAQTQFSDETDEECVYGLGCRVNASETGFALRLFGKTETVASIAAKLDHACVETALGVVRDLNQWRTDKVREISAARAAAAAPAP